MAMSPRNSKVQFSISLLLGSWSPICSRLSKASTPRMRQVLSSRLCTHPRTDHAMFTSALCVLSTPHCKPQCAIYCEKHCVSQGLSHLAGICDTVLLPDSNSAVVDSLLDTFSCYTLCSVARLVHHQLVVTEEPASTYSCSGQ